MDERSNARAVFNSQLDLVTVWLFLNFQICLFEAVNFVRNNVSVIFDPEKNYTLSEICAGYKMLARTMLDRRWPDFEYGIDDFSGKKD